MPSMYEWCDAESSLMSVLGVDDDGERRAWTSERGVSGKASVTGENRLELSEQGLRAYSHILHAMTGMSTWNSVFLLIVLFFAI